MTEKQLDIFFIESLQKILMDAKDCADYVKKESSKEYDEIKAGYKEQIETLERLLKTVHSIEDFADEDEETIDCVYGYIENYTDNFVISADEAQKKKDLAILDKLEELLNLFIDVDDDEDYDSE